MPGFDAIYKQTVTVFNRVVEGESTKWYATVISGVHLVIDQSIIVATYGEQSSDNGCCISDIKTSMVRLWLVGRPI